MPDRDALAASRRNLRDLETALKRAKALISALTEQQAQQAAESMPKASPNASNVRREAKAATTTKAARAKKAPGERKTSARKSKSKRTAAAELALDGKPAPLPEAVRPLPADPSKAPGKQHRRPPMSFKGVKHSQEYIAKARVREFQTHSRG